MAPDELSFDRGRNQHRASAQLTPSRHIPIQQHSRWSFQRAPAPAAGITVKVDTPADEPTAKVEKRQSKMSLFSLFAPPKVERSRGYTEAGLEAIAERQAASHISIPDRKTSRPASSISIVREEPTVRQPLASSASSIRTTTSLAGWDAPPLFQAYPQAIKYATLQASMVSTEMLQRAQGHERRLSHLQEQFEGTGNLTLDTTDMTGIRTPKKAQRATLSKKRYSNAQSGGAPLASKVYVLVTSGYLLQYSGEGSASRLPERILPLDKESVAFASDLIPGKHFVLEVQQKPHENSNALAVPQQQSRSLLKRLRSQPQVVRKSTNTMLLILDGADEMISWMKAVRRVIDDKNGRSHTPSPSREVKRDSGHDAGETPKELPSHRYRVQRPASFYDSSKSNNSTSVMSRAPSIRPPHGSGADSGEAGREVEAVRTRTSSRSRVLPTEEGSAPPTTTPGPRASVRESVEAPSIATTASASSQDQIKLDKLRDSRHSVLSTRTSATGNATTTTASSPPSPGEEYLTANPVNKPPTPRSSFIAANPSINLQRRSFQRLPATAELPNAGLPDAPLPLATLRAFNSESNLLSIVKSPAEKNLRRLSSQTTTSTLRKRTSTGPTYRSQSALEHRRPTDPRASTISATSEGAIGTQQPIEEQQTELEAATDAAAEIASMMEPDSQRLSALGSLPNLSNPSLLSLHRQQQSQHKDRIPASVRQKYKSASPVRPAAGQAAAAEMQNLMNAEPLTTHENVSSHSLSSMHHRQQAEDKERIPTSLREKYQARRRERAAAAAQSHVRSPEDEAAAAQMQSIMNPDARGVAAAESSTDIAQLPLEVQYKQQQEQDKNRVPMNVRHKFQNAAAGRISESDERIDQETAAAQIQSIMDPEDRVSSRMDNPGKLPSQSIQAMYKAQQNQDKNRIPAELRNKFKAGAGARHSRQSQEIDSDAAAAQIQAIMDPSVRDASGLPAKPAFQSIHSMHKSQLNQDKERIPAATRKKYQRPIPIRVSQPGQNVDRPLPKATPTTEQPIIPKRLSSLPSPAFKSTAGGHNATASGQPPSPSIAHFPQPPRRSSSAALSPISDEGSIRRSLAVAPASPPIGSNNNSPTLPTSFNQANGADVLAPQGLRRPVSLQVRSTAAPFLSSRPQPNSGARRSLTSANNAAPARPASAQAFSRSGRASPGPAVAFSGLQTVGEARTLRAMGPSDPLKQASERLALRSGMKRAPSPIGVKVRVSMPTIGINGPPVRIEPMLPMSINPDLLPASPGPPPSCALPAVPGPPPARALPAIPGSARTSMRSASTPPTPQVTAA